MFWFRRWCRLIQGWSIRPSWKRVFDSSALPDLFVRGVDDDLVQALKKRAGAHGRSQEAELWAILAAALLSPPRRNLAE